MSSSYGIDVPEVESQLHPIFKTDPAELAQFLNKKVLLHTMEGLAYEGWVYTIDPVTHTWVLMTHPDTADSSQPIVHLVMDAAVTSTDVLDSDTPEYISQLFETYGQSIKVQITAEELSERRDAVCRWFTVNRIPVTKNGEAISVANGALTIEPPYHQENCYSSNEIILARVRTLLASLPPIEDI